METEKRRYVVRVLELPTQLRELAQAIPYTLSRSLAENQSHGFLRLIWCEVASLKYPHSA